MLHLFKKIEENINIGWEMKNTKGTNEASKDEKYNIWIKKYTEWN